MNYELAKELKDAGFYQQQTAGINKYPGYCGYGLGYIDDQGIYYPTLSELINALDNDFESIARINYPEGKIYYSAYQTDECYERNGGECEVGCCGYENGNTPEESVANLWLSLNKHGK